MARCYPLLTEAPDAAALAADRGGAREIGVVALGETFLFFRKGRRTYYIAYREIGRCFRRVMLVTSKLCCGRGDLQVENLVICDGEDRELAVVQLPGTRAAEALMEAMKELAPHAKLTNQ